MKARERSEASDEMLMIRYQRGDTQAFTVLLGRYETPIYGFVIRHLGNASLAEDVTQDVFLRLVQNATDFKHEARFSTWLFTIARNLCVDQLRRLSHRRHASLDQPSAAQPDAPPLLDRLADPRSDVERSVVAEQLARHIERAIGELPEEQREVFLLRELGDLPFKDIAEMTQVGENTVKSRMRYALERLQEKLRDYSEYSRALK